MHDATRLTIRQGDASRGSVIASPVQRTYDSEYILPVQIGTPPQTLPMNLDTGSADLYVSTTTLLANFRRLTDY